jgi:NAD+ synthase
MKMYTFDAKKIKDEIVIWIREFFANSGEGCNCIIGVSGGKDSSVVAALCVEALGKERVLGVLMPDGTQKDILYAKDLCDHLDIERVAYPTQSSDKLHVFATRPLLL